MFAVQFDDFEQCLPGHHQFHLRKEDPSSRLLPLARTLGIRKTDLAHRLPGLRNILGAVVQPDADSGWIARAGVRVRSQIDTGIGALQPYGRFNVYKTSSGTDVARFVNGATRTDIAASAGGTSTELAGGFTLAIGQTTSLYGEIGKFWSSGGNAKVKSSLKGFDRCSREVVVAVAAWTPRCPRGPSPSPSRRSD